MEYFFLLLLVAIMGLALSSGFPVAFSLPGSAVLTIGIAALSGYLFAGDAAAYFYQDGPIQWLSSGVTNFRSVYWEVDRDTLIAVPLFVFMGIMLQRSKIAEDLLVAMARLFGPIPGGLGISVVFVGALLAATTGIVGATVIAMGMISLPAMLRHNYSKPLATGVICASGTLGQIIPPSIVLIILADQLSNAADVANNMRRAEYRVATGQGVMPSEFEVVSASAGDMFVGAFLPGMVLVGIYMLYILITAVLRPGTAPPVPYDGKYDWNFAKEVILALVPPLALIFIVLGSIILGIATVNQAGAIGAIGAIVMASYRLSVRNRWTYVPAIMTLVPVVVIALVLQQVPLNIKNINTPAEELGLSIAAIASVIMLMGIAWATWRSFRIEDTLRGVMLETAKTTSMVFIILLGAAMLTAAFRGFGGEHLVKEFLTGLPGGFWTQFLVVMFVIFILGFFIDFIEISVVVVPIVAPILLADPQANITAVWLGVMLGLNLQTSFLTPPFGFALFYLRGVSPPEVQTTQIYRGAVAFIGLQIVGIMIAASYPPIVNYLPNRTYLTSDTAPPPVNPKIQQCLEGIIHPKILAESSQLELAVNKLQSADFTTLPESNRKALENSAKQVLSVGALIRDIQTKQQELEEYSVEYAVLHYPVRDLQKSIQRLEKEKEDLQQTVRRLQNTEDPVQAARRNELAQRIEDIQSEQAQLQAQIPSEWEEARQRFMELAENERKARLAYRRSVEEAYHPLIELEELLQDNSGIGQLRTVLEGLLPVLETANSKDATEALKQAESLIGEVPGSYGIKSPLSKARRLFRKEDADRQKAREFVDESLSVLASEIAWRQDAKQNVLPAIREYAEALKPTVGLRSQPRLSVELAKEVSVCQADHRDVSLYF